MKTFVCTIALGTIGGCLDFLNVEIRAERTEKLGKKIRAAVREDFPGNAIAGDNGITQGFGNFFSFFRAKGNGLNVAGELIHDDEQRSIGTTGDTFDGCEIHRDALEWKRKITARLVSGGWSRGATHALAEVTLFAKTGDVIVATFPPGNVVHGAAHRVCGIMGPERTDMKSAENGFAIEGRDPKDRCEVAGVATFTKHDFPATVSPAVCFGIGCFGLKSPKFGEKDRGEIICIGNHVRERGKGCYSGKIGANVGQNGRPESRGNGLVAKGRILSEKWFGDEFSWRRRFDESGAGIEESMRICGRDESSGNGDRRSGGRKRVGRCGRSRGRKGVQFGLKSGVDRDRVRNRESSGGVLGNA